MIIRLRGEMNNFIKTIRVELEITLSLHIICMSNFFADIGEVGRSARVFSELAGRTESMVSDVVLTLIEMGKFSQIYVVL